MSFNSWMKGLFGKSDTFTLVDNAFCCISTDRLNALAIKRWAIDSCVNKIANALCKAEIQTFVEGKEERDLNWYLFNIEASPNQNATEFWKKIVFKLVYENEALVFQVGDALYVADSFSQVKYAFKENQYTDVVLKEFSMSKTFNESEVMHLVLNNESVKKIIDAFYVTYEDLLNTGIAKYKKLNARKLIVKIKGLFGQGEEEEAKIRELMTDRMQKFLSEKDSALPLEDGMEIDELKSDGKIADSRDIKKMIDDVFEMIANSFHIPLGLAKGDTVGLNDQMNAFLMFCLNPIAEMVNAEVNRKYYGRDAVLKRTYMKMDTSMIKVQDLKDSASALELLFRTGTNTVDDNLAMVGRERTGLPENEERYISKNYAPQGEEVESTKGGEVNENA
ncbi:phage portal protein [Listeria booriae]|uniref:phage portal protein n=1 Tax=Listeria booriae TaxID=1552123 RepID=UPI0021AB7096|nr:phage portal protein [Listeria booriae]